MQTRAARIASQGGPSVIEITTAELSAPSAGEVRVRQTAIGLNFMDVYQRGGAYPLSLPSGLGLEAAGVVEEVGPDVTDLRPGMRVAYAGGPPGAYAAYRNLPAGQLVEIPDGVSDEQAAAVLLKGMTVEYLMERCYPVKPGEDVLFYAAAGGVGTIAGQWGKALGARMIGVAGGADKCARARDHGYADVIDRTTEEIAQRVKALTGDKGVPVAYDSVGKATFAATMDSLAPRGVFVSFGASSGKPPAVEAGDLQRRGSLYFTRPSLANYCVARDDLTASAARVFEMVAKGAVTIEIGQRYPLDDAVKAHSDLEGGRTTGSSILLP